MNKIMFIYSIIGIMWLLCWLYINYIHDIKYYIKWSTILKKKYNNYDFLEYELAPRISTLIIISIMWPIGLIMGSMLILI